jgi:dTDP-4-amino-4,6-dideoxygalactose transaminase
MVPIPFNDVGRQNQSVRAGLDAAYARVLGAGSFIQGEEVAAFEEEYSQYLGVKHVIGCSNGTDALELLLFAHNIGPGNEVITVANTFFATIEAIVAVGATPVFAEIDQATGLIDVKTVAPLITPQTKAIVVVHLYGQPVELKSITALAARHGLVVLEDAAQAHGAEYQGKRIGGHGHAASFSFFPGKNLGALGDAGAISTNNDSLAAHVRLLRDHGRTEKYMHKKFGWNKRMDGMQAAFLRCKLKHLDRWNSERKAIVELYTTELKKTVPILQATDGGRSSNHLFVILHRHRDALAKALKSDGVESGCHYPLGCHRQEAWRVRFPSVSLPITEAIADQCLSLPLFGGMRETEGYTVVESLKKALASVEFT